MHDAIHIDGYSTCEHLAAPEPPTCLVPLFEALANMRSTLGRLLDHVMADGRGSMTIDRPAELVHALGLDSKLASQLLRAIQADRIELFAAKMPSFKGLRRIADLALAAGGDRKVAETYVQAIDQAEQAVADHFEDRWAFDAFISNYRNSLDAKEASTELEDRKRAYRASSEVLGFTCETEFHAYLVAPSQAAHGRFDLAGVRMKRGLRRFRPGVRIPVHAERARVGQAVDRTPVYLPPPRAIFEQPTARQESDLAGHARSAIAPRWTSPDNLPIDQRVSRSGLAVLELAGNDVGKASRCNITTARLSEGMIPSVASTGPGGEPTHFRIASHIRSPVARLVTLIGIADERPNPIHPLFSMISSFPLDQDWSDANIQPLNLRMTTETLGAAARAPMGSRMYPINDVVNGVLDELGWHNRRFAFWSAEVAYPLTNTTISCRLMLPHARGDDAAEPPTVSQAEVRAQSG